MNMRITKIITNIVYSTGLCVLLITTLPKYIYRIFVHKKYRKSLKKRLGIQFPKIEKQGRKLIWIHAVSVGETRAVVPLVKKLMEQDDKPIIILSCTTETGYAEGERSLPDVDYHVYLPFDVGFIIRPIVRRCKPDTVIMVETDFWYNFLDEAKKNGATIAIANGKISKKSQHRHQACGFLSKEFFDVFDIFCIQSETYRRRFKKLNIPQKKLIVTGNLKLESTYKKLSTKELASWREKLHITENRPVVVIGSTHDPEEKILLNAIKTLRQSIPNVYTIIVPRHPERFDDVTEILKDNKENFVRYTNKKDITGNEDVILVDAMGLLRKCYQLADVAIVGGCFTEDVGGHNILEPSWYGIPVICGPFMFSQPDFLAIMKEYNAGIQTTEEDIATTLKELLLNEDKRKSLGDAGRRLWQEQSGAVAKTLQALFNEQ